jgi:uncharacterized protein (TIGR03083 family)
MNDNAVFEAVAGERLALADVLDGLTQQQWDTPSLCEGWLVRDVAAHLVMPLVTPLRRFAVAMVKAKGSFHAANQALTAHTAREHGDRLPTMLREHADSRFTPPGSGPLVPLTDVMVHGQDIRRPLAITGELDPDRTRTVLDFLVSPAATRGFTRSSLQRLRWEATDLEWAGGSGPTVTGPAEAILLTLTGRGVARPELSGEGLERLATV